MKVAPSRSKHPLVLVARRVRLQPGLDAGRLGPVAVRHESSDRPISASSSSGRCAHVERPGRRRGRTATRAVHLRSPAAAVQPRDRGRSSPGSEVDPGRHQVSREAVHVTVAADDGSRPPRRRREEAGHGLDVSASAAVDAKSTGPACPPTTSSPPPTPSRSASERQEGAHGHRAGAAATLVRPRGEASPGTARVSPSSTSTT
jgi:hypothetical protein